MERTRNAIIFFSVLVIWLVFDIETKSLVNGYDAGEVIAGPFGGLFQIRLIHNTGAAWGMFENSTIFLGIISLIVCIALAIYLFVVAPHSSGWIAFGLALVCAGGLGNAIDRFTQGYVVDFIEPTFIDFPVFNIADVGVTCGFIIFLIAIIVQWRKGNAVADSEPSDTA